MKKAIGRYKGVRAVTKEEALAIVPVVFCAELDQLRTELDRYRAFVDWCRAERDRICAERDRLIVEQNRLMAELSGYSPDWRAINFIAADHPNAVYCFVYCTTRHRKELWIYDGENCPNARGIKRRKQIIWTEDEGEIK